MAQTTQDTVHSDLWGLHVLPRALQMPARSSAFPVKEYVHALCCQQTHSLHLSRGTQRVYSSKPLKQSMDYKLPYTLVNTVNAV